MQSYVIGSTALPKRSFFRITLSGGHHLADVSDGRFRNWRDSEGML